MTLTACDHCGGSLDHIHPARRAVARFCSAACRAAWRREHDATHAPSTARLSRQRLAEELGVSVRTISRWMAVGLPFERLRNGRPQFGLEECRKWSQQPVESRRLRAASCTGCGYAIHIEERFADAPPPGCPCGAGPLTPCATTAKGGVVL